MKKSRIGHQLKLLPAFIASGLMISGCSNLGYDYSASSSYSSPSSYAEPEINCWASLENAVHDKFYGASYTTSQDLNNLRNHCTEENEIYQDVLAVTSHMYKTGEENCANLFIPGADIQAVYLLADNDICDFSHSSDQKTQLNFEPEWPDGGLGWDEAYEYVGTWQRVCGPIRSVRGADYGVFINIGRDYPSSNRFTFVLWGDWWLDPIPSDAVVCASGQIYLYDGAITQMEIAHPSDLEIWN